MGLLVHPLELYLRTHPSAAPSSGGLFSRVKCGGTGWKALGLGQAGGDAAAAPAEGSAWFGQDLRLLGQCWGASGWALTAGTGCARREQRGQLGATSI